jgi:hypothetical protein
LRAGPQVHTTEQGSRLNRSILWPVAPPNGNSEEAGNLAWASQPQRLCQKPLPQGGGGDPGLHQLHSGVSPRCYKHRGWWLAVGGGLPEQPLCLRQGLQQPRDDHCVSRLWETDPLPSLPKMEPGLLCPACAMPLSFVWQLVLFFNPFLYFYFKT